MQPSWNPNPDGTPTERWWDGSDWTDQVRPAPPGNPPPDQGGPPRPLAGPPRFERSAKPAATPPSSAAPSPSTPPASTTPPTPPAAATPPPQRDQQPASAAAPNPVPNTAPRVAANNTNRPGQPSNSLRGGLIASALLVGLLLIGGCIAIANVLTGPTTIDQVCEQYSETQRELLNRDGFTDNDFFRDLNRLADVSQRYPDSPSVQEAGKELERLHDNGSVSGFELIGAFAPIEWECSLR